MNVKHLIPQQVPEFILQKYPAFVEFVQAYYEWFEQEQVGLIEDLVDVDKTLDKFIQYFKKELDANGVLYNNDNKLFLRHIKDLYKAKGSEASFDLFFKLIYKKSAETFYPWDQTLKASDGKWVQDASFFVQLAPGIGFPKDLVGKTVNVLTETISYDVFIDRFAQVEIEVDGVKQFSTDTFEFFIDRRWYNLIPNNAAVVLEGLSRGTTVLTTSEVKIITRGQKFRAGEVYEVRDGNGTGSLVKVNTIGPDAEILKCQLIKFGIEYTQSFVATIVPPNTPPELINDYKATLDIKIGASAKYPGYYVTNDGLLNDAMFLQDSFYYQVYSYVIRVNEQLKDYKNLLKQIIHPTGLMLFGEYDINNNFAVAAQLKESAILIQSRIRDFLYIVDSIKKHFTRPVPDDYFYSTDSVSLHFTKSRVSDAYTANDFITFKQFNKVLSDLLSSTDQIQFFDVIKRLIDYNSTTDQILFYFDKTLTTSFTEQDNVALSFNKYLEESEGISVDDFGHVWYGDIYWEYSYCANDDGLYNETGLVRSF